MSAVGNHDYHLVEPSKWPAVGAISAFMIAFGGVFSLHAFATVGFPSWDATGFIIAIGFWSTFAGFFSDLLGFIGGIITWIFYLINSVSLYIFFAGVAGLLYTFIGWWRDVISEAEGGFHTPTVQIGLRYGMILFIASEVMFFVVWFWAYFNAALFPTAEIGGVWPPVGVETFDPWHIPFVNTLVLLLSGTTVTWAHHEMIEGNRDGLKKGLWATVILGVLFTSLQVYEYVHAKFAFGGDIYGSTFFMATGFHGFHVIIGTVFLAVCLGRAFKGQFTPKQHFGFEAAAWYWHFVDVVWLFLFTSIYWWGAAS